MTLVPGQEPGTARSAVRRQRGQSSTCRTSSRRRAVPSTSWLSPVRRATLGQVPVSTTASAARVRSTSQAAEPSSSRAEARSMPRTAATSWAASWWRTASSSASRCSGVVPAASGQASRASSLRRCAWASSETGALSASAARRSAASLSAALSAALCRVLPVGLVLRAGVGSLPEAPLWLARPRTEAWAPWRLRLVSASLRRQAQRASAYSQALRSPAASGARAPRRSASASTSPRAAVAASWSHRTDRQ